MWKEAIVRELAVVLALKLAVLYVIWFAFFNDPNERELTHHEMGQLLLGDPRKSATSSLQSTQQTGERDGH